ncbi:GTP-binding protein [Acidobacteria bacterium AH-259-D05]|nr:GTP-binding protein [Acidobacteria bacterium AH-259-D05]
MSTRVRIPITLITGFLGSGKTTLLRHILDGAHGKIAILMNEFGEIAIDSVIVEGKNIRLTELDGGCVCCSLIGEFEAAVEEIIDTTDSEIIVVETTGVAEPEALTFDIQESLPRVRLDGVITIVDAEATLKYPQLGQTTRMQIEQADTLLLNKIDLVSNESLVRLEEQLHELNEQASIVRTERCRVDPDLLFGLTRDRQVNPPQHLHQVEFDSFIFTTEAIIKRDCFEQFVEHLNRCVYRAKGFVRFPEGTHLFNFVAGRWELESVGVEKSVLVFIGEDVKSRKDAILAELRKCEGL